MSLPVSLDVPVQAAAPDPDYIGLWEYFSECFVPFQQLHLPLKGMHREICDTIEDASLGYLQRRITPDNPEGEAPIIVVNMPPRVGKTKIMEAWMSWGFGFFPDSQYILTGYGGQLAQLSSRYIRSVVISQWYQELFPLTKLGQVRKADHWSTSEGGNLYAEGVDGELTGKGGGLKRPAGGGIGIDDAAKPREALSAAVALSLREWFSNTLISRRNSSTWCPIVCNAQRLSEEDLPGYLIRTYPDLVIHIKYAALVNGVSLIPETVSTDTLLAMQAANPPAFSAQYQQEPMILGGNMIKKEWFRYHDNSLTLYEEKIITCDTAMMAKQHNDWTVLQVWGKMDNRAYLIDQVREKMLAPQMLSTAATLYQKHNTHDCPISRMIIEEAASGPALLQSLNQAGIPAQGIKPHRDKVVRVEDILAFIMTGMVLFPRDVPWLPEFELELMGFRKDGLAPHDDVVDTLAYGVSGLLGSAMSILDVLGKPGEG